MLAGVAIAMLLALVINIAFDGQLRTLQRRLKDWRHTLAHKMVFGVATSGEMPGPASLHSPDTVGVTLVS